MWEVIVSNIGSVYRGRDVDRARKTYREYIQIVDDWYGRAGGEAVTLICDDEVMEERQREEEQ